MTEIVLRASDFHWINGISDDSIDQCAHGSVLFSVNDTVFVKPEDGDWTLSASALFLLRSIKDNHNAQESVTEDNLLFPCCGFTVWPIGKKYKVLVLGCPNGIDVQITHQGSSVIISSSKGTETVEQFEWTKTLLDFVDKVNEFYKISRPKQKLTDKQDRRGWDGFWKEFRKRYKEAKAALENAA